MILKFIDLILGSAGNMFQDLYMSNTSWVNSIVVLYAVFILWTHMNLRKMIRNFEKEIPTLAKQYEDNLHNRYITRSLLKKWHKENDRKKFWLPTKNDLWFEIIDGKDIPRKFHLDSEYINTALIKLTNHVHTEGLSPQSFVDWDEYRHHLLTGIRRNAPRAKK